MVGAQKRHPLSFPWEMHLSEHLVGVAALEEWSKALETVDETTQRAPAVS